MTDTLKTYRVTLTSDVLAGPFVVDLASASERGAVKRARYAAMHTYRCVPLLTCPVRAEVLHDGTCAAAGHNAETCGMPL